jgi:hypothetical protein
MESRAIRGKKRLEKTKDKSIKTKVKKVIEGKNKSYEKAIQISGYFTDYYIIQ